MPPTHRLQVLVDEERFQRLQVEAERTGATIGAIVRQAIDAALPPDPDHASIEAAGARLLDAPPMPVGDWAAMKRQLADELHGGTDR